MEESTFPYRLAAKIDFDGDCWTWMGRKDRDGYGRVYWQERENAAHRLVYETLVGPIPDGLVIDHLCRVKMCVNPDHLQPVTQGENVRRGARFHGDACRKCGSDNYYPMPNGQRCCRVCRAAYKRKWKRRRAEALAAAA